MSSIFLILFFLRFPNKQKSHGELAHGFQDGRGSEIGQGIPKAMGKPIFFASRFLPGFFPSSIRSLIASHLS
jgi:hypothetical protein